VKRKPHPSFMEKCRLLKKLGLERGDKKKKKCGEVVRKMIQTQGKPLKRVKHRQCLLLSREALLQEKDVEKDPWEKKQDSPGSTVQKSRKCSGFIKTYCCSSGKLEKRKKGWSVTAGAEKKLFIPLNAGENQN